MPTAVEPKSVQFVPSGEREAEKLSPKRVSRTQYGTLTPPVFATPIAEAPEEARCWSATPFAGDVKLMTYFESALSDSRIITPALAQAAVFCMFVTRAVIMKLPLTA